MKSTYHLKSSVPTGQAFFRERPCCFTVLLSTGQTQKELEALFPDKRKQIHPIFGVGGCGKGKIGKLNPLTGEPGAKQPHANHE